MTKIPVRDAIRSGATDKYLRKPKKQRQAKPPKLTFMLDLGGGTKKRVTKRVTPSFTCTRNGYVWMYLNNAATGAVVAAIGLPAGKAFKLGEFLEKAALQSIGVS